MTTDALPRPEVFDHVSLPASVAWQAVTFMRCEWTGLFDGGLRWIGTPFGDRESPTYVVLRRHEVLLAHAALIRAPVLHDGVELAVAGLGCVFTMPPYRSAGHAGTVLREVGRLIDAGGADLGMLFCDPELAAFYERFGWTPCSGGTLEGNGQAVRELRMIRPVSARATALAASLTTSTVRVGSAW
ncbi:MAG: GNAT family N-acetyltransferase [Kineosporiaceae bacterium]